MYLGILPRDSRTVSWVLNPQSGLVSPRFHVKQNNFFEEVNTGSVNDQLSFKW